MRDVPYSSVGPLRAVIFDYFGTLTRAVRRGQIHRRMARHLGCDPDRWLDLLTRTYHLRATGQMGDPIAVLNWLASTLDANPGRRALHDVYAARLSAIRTDGPLRPEAVPVLRALRAHGVRTALVSNCWYELPLVLPTLPVAPLLDAHVFSVDVGRCKPDPAMYFAACARLAVTPEECLYIGDGDSHELTGAAAIGMTALRLAAPDLSGHLSFDPDVAFRGPSVISLQALIPLASRHPVPV
jgi:putative hydrolase of the HAD superfamily